MAILQLFLASSIPVVKTILVTLVGSFIALDRINIFPPEARKHFNHAVFYVFNPALIFANLAKTLTMKSMITLWYMPLNIMMTFLMGTVLGYVCIYVTRAPSHLRGLIIGLSSAGNLGNMLLIIIPAVCTEKSSPFGDSEVCLEYGMAYVSLSLAIGSIYLWSYVYNIVRVSSIKHPKRDDSINGERNTISPETSIEAPPVRDSGTNRVTNTSSEETSIEAPPVRDSGTNRVTDISSEETSIEVAPVSVTNRENTDDTVLSSSVSDQKVEALTAVKTESKFKTFAKKMNLKRLLSPSTIGSIVGLIVGITPPFRKVLIGESAPLHVIHDSATLLGQGAIPVASLIMGANLNTGLKGRGVQKWIIISIMVARYIFLPVFGILVTKMASNLGWVRPDPLFKFVLLLQYAIPPAMNISTITQLFGAGESECSVILLWSYALASVALTLWSTLFMYLVSK